MKFMSNLKGKIAIVTGSAQGIGRAIAEKLAQEGAAVVVNSRKINSDVEEVVVGINRRGGQAIAVEADVSRLPDIENLFRECVRRLGQPDILVNNAGIMSMGNLMEITAEEYERVFSVNSRGVLFSLKAAAEFLNDGGRIVNISSSGTVFPMPGTSVYAASKATVKAYTAIAALELGVRGITVNSVMPGPTATPMTNQIPDEAREMVVNNSPFKRMGQPPDIADVVAFLASDDARWISGQNILVNGAGKI